MLPWDKLKEECGIFAIVSHPEAVRLTYLGFVRSAASRAGICRHRELGWKATAPPQGYGACGGRLQCVATREAAGHSAIGHVRYSTAGDSDLANAQPILIDSWRSPIALAHNGNLTNAAHIRRELERDGAIFHSTSDSEVILHLLSRSKRRTVLDAFVKPSITCEALSRW